MAQPGYADIIRHDLTGAATTDFQFYAGQAKGPYSCFLVANTVSLPGGAAVAFNTDTTNSTVLPFAAESAAAAIVGVLDQSFAAGPGLALVKTAGTFTAGIVSSAASLAARAHHWVATDTAGTWQTKAVTSAESKPVTLSNQLAAINAGTIAAEGTSAVLQLTNLNA